MSEPAKSGGELFLVESSNEGWKGLIYLQDWTGVASAFDIATGFKGVCEVCGISTSAATRSARNGSKTAKAAPSPPMSEVK